MNSCRQLETEVKHSRTNAEDLLQVVLKEAFTSKNRLNQDGQDERMNRIRVWGDWRGEVIEIQTPAYQQTGIFNGKKHSTQNLQDD